MDQLLSQPWSPAKRRMSIYAVDFMKRTTGEKVEGRWGGKRQEQSASNFEEKEDGRVRDKNKGSAGCFVRATRLCALVPSAAYRVSAQICEGNPRPYRITGTNTPE